MKTAYWTRLDAAIMITVSLMMLAIAGLSVEFKERGRFQVASHNSDARYSIAADSTASLKLSGVSLALR